LVNNLEAECQARFAAACQAGLSKSADEEKCQGLLRRYARSIDSFEKHASIEWLRLPGDVIFSAGVVPWC
jgi:hypothetical protein